MSDKKPMSSRSRNKAATFRKISHAVFQLEESKGHLAWKVTDLVRKISLSRSLIYEYMGSSKKEILLSSLRHFINDFYGFDKLENPGSAPRGISNARERMIQFPEAILFYQKWRARESWLQSEFIAIEKKFQQRLKKAYPHLTERQVLGVHAAIHGVVTAPFLSSEQAETVYEEYFRMICSYTSVSMER